MDNLTAQLTRSIQMAHLARKRRELEHKLVALAASQGELWTLERAEELEELISKIIDQQLTLARQGEDEERTD